MFRPCRSSCLRIRSFLLTNSFTRRTRGMYEINKKAFLVPPILCIHHGFRGGRELIAYETRMYLACQIAVKEQHTCRLKSIRIDPLGCCQMCVHPPPQLGLCVSRLVLLVQESSTSQQEADEAREGLASALVRANARIAELTAKSANLTRWRCRTFSSYSYSNIFCAFCFLV